MILKLKNVRLAFSQNLFRPGAQQAGQTPKYGCALLIGKEDPQVSTIKQAIIATAKEKWGPEKAEKLLKALGVKP